MPDRLITNNRRAYFRSSNGQFLGYKGKFRVNTLEAGIANFYFETRKEMEDRAVDFANELRDYAQQNAPWSDRTGDARSGLDSLVEADDDQLQVSLFHGVDYGIWLEIRWNGRYAIIIPTIEAKGSELLQKWEGMLSEIKYY